MAKRHLNFYQSGKNLLNLVTLPVDNAIWQIRSKMVNHDAIIIL